MLTTTERGGGSRTRTPFHVSIAPAIDTHTFRTVTRRLDTSVKKSTSPAAPISVLSGHVDHQLLIVG